jgi:osmotically-inducible protein OsmY
MLRLVSTALIIIASVALLTGCHTTSSGTADSSKTTMTNSELENLVRGKLNSDAQLKGANLGVSANAERNEVTLTGTVDSQALRTRAVDLTKSAHSGLIVTDKIEVKPREVARAEYNEDQARSERAKAKDYKDKIGDSLDDAGIHMKLVAKLIGKTNTPERNINVDVVNNVVTLRGTVDTPEQKAEAERVARNTEGVKGVNNQLKIASKAKA